MGSKPFHQLISWDGGRSNRPVTIVEGWEHNRFRCSGNGSRNVFLPMSSSFSSRFHRRWSLGWVSSSFFRTWKFGMGMRAQYMTMRVGWTRNFDVKNADLDFQNLVLVFWKKSKYYLNIELWRWCFHKSDWKNLNITKSYINLSKESVCRGYKDIGVWLEASVGKTFSELTSKGIIDGLSSRSLSQWMQIGVGHVLICNRGNVWTRVLVNVKCVRRTRFVNVKRVHVRMLRGFHRNCFGFA
jgi:hypothetical protein